MKLGRIMGNVVATEKHPFYEGHRLLLVEPIDAKGKKTGTTQIGIDQVQAGPGDLVLFVDEGNSARTVLGNPQAPARLVIVGIVDKIEMREA